MPKVFNNADQVSSKTNPVFSKKASVASSQDREENQLDRTLRLYDAIDKRDKDQSLLIETFLKQGATVLALYPYTPNAFHRACDRRDVKALKTVVSSSLQILGKETVQKAINEIDRTGSTPLHIAVKRYFIIDISI